MGVVEAHWLIIFIAAAQAILPNCNEYCKSKSSNLSNINWQNCNCTDIKVAANETDKGDLNLDDTGIYYEPAETFSAETISFSGVPFFILNPALKSLHSKQNDSDNTKTSQRSAAMRAAEEDGDEETMYLHEPLIKPIPKQRKNDSNIHKIDIETNEFPIYLDIDIHAPTKNSGRSTIQDVRKIDNIQKIEQELRDCLDLHVVQLARTHHNTEVLHTDFKKYDNLSDVELVTEIKNKCGQPTNIIDESLKEIQNRWPKKMIEERRYAEEQDNSRDGNPIKPNDDIENMTIIDQMESTPTANIPVFDTAKSSSINDEKNSTSDDMDIKNMYNFDNAIAETNHFELQLIPTTAIFPTTTNKAYKDRSTNTEPSNIVLNTETTTGFPVDITTNRQLNELNTSTIKSRSIEDDIDFTTGSNNILFTGSDYDTEKDMETSNSDFINNFLNLDASGEAFSLERDNNQIITTTANTINYTKENITDTVTTVKTLTSPISHTIKPILELELNNNISVEHVIDHANNTAIKEEKITTTETSTEIISRKHIVNENLNRELNNDVEADDEIQSSHNDIDNVTTNYLSDNTTTPNLPTANVPKTIFNLNETNINEVINSTVIMTVQTTPRSINTSTEVTQSYNVNSNIFDVNTTAVNSSIVTVTMPIRVATEGPEFNENNFTNKAVTEKQNNNSTIEEMITGHVDTITKPVTAIYEVEAQTLTTPEPRIKLQESEINLPKISTVEFHNETVKSVVDGNETIPNGDFKEFDTNPSTHSDTKANEVESRNHSPLALDTTMSTPPATQDYKMSDLEVPDLEGQLYFLYDQQQIPARFVQKSNGKIYVGLDGSSLCDRLIEDGEKRSVFLSALCNYIKSKNCTAT